MSEILNGRAAFFQTHNCMYYQYSKVVYKLNFFFKDFKDIKIIDSGKKHGTCFLTS